MRSSRVFGILLSTVMIFSAFMLCGCEKESIEVLKVATNAEFPPYEYYENNEMVGIDIELAKAIAEEMGCELEIIDMDFGSIIPSIKSGKADVALAAMSVTEEKLVDLDFSESYATASQLILVPVDSQINSVADLKGKRIGVEIYTTGSVYVADIEDATPEEFANGTQAVDALKEGRIDAVIIDSEPARVYSERNDDIRIIDEPLTEEEYAIGVAKNNTKLLNRINEAIGKLKSSGKLDEIKEKYIKAD